MEIIDDDDDPTEEEINNLADKIEADRKNGLVDMTASVFGWRERCHLLIKRLFKPIIKRDTEK